MQKVVIVTGASGGVGTEIATKFGSTGAKVVVNYFRTAQDADHVVKEINKGPGEALSYRADVRNFEEVKGMVKETVERWNRVDVLVNNAGGGARILGLAENKICEMDEEIWEAVVDINLKGAMLCTKAVAPQMIKQRDGHIVNIGSRQWHVGKKGNSAYAAAKAGLIAFTKAAARELGEYNIKVNIVVLGLTSHRKNIQFISSLGANEPYTNQTALQRTQTANELADLIVHLTEWNNISGQTFYPDSWVGTSM